MKVIDGIRMFIVRSALLLLCCLLAEVLPAQTVRAQKGVLDLRNANLNTSPVLLKGEWLFYWNHLLKPTDPLPTTNHYADYPSLWREQAENGKPLPSEGFASYALTIYLPKQHQELALEIPGSYSSYQLFVNGKLVAQNGHPDTSAELAEPFWSTEMAELGRPTDTLHLVMHVANFWHNKGGTYKEISLGNKSQLFLKHDRSTALDLLLAGCLLMGGLFFWGLYRFGKKDKIIFYFSLFCIITSYRMVGTELYVLHSLFPHLSWFVAIRLEYLTLVAGVALFSQYTRMLYPKDANQLVMKAVILYCLMYALCILILPPVLFTAWLNFFLAVMFLYTVYAFYVYIHAVIHKRKGSIYALLSSGVMLLVYFTVNLQYFNLIPDCKPVVSAGYIAFFFLQSLVLSHRFAEILQQAAVEAQQGLKAKTEFLSTMSHEIRTPLNSVIGMAHLLNRSEPRKDQEEQVNVLLFSANNLLSIVNNILDYNKIEAGKISIEHIPMDLPAIAQNIVAGLKSQADEKRIAITLKVDPQIAKKVMGDPTRTGQVLNNLIQNAIKFTREGGVTVSIVAEKTEADNIAIKVSVQDTGIGIPAEKQQLIFERFTQADSSTSRSFGGTGLGLSISKKILELQGCMLQLTSEAGKGSTFYFTQVFPVTDEPIENAQSLATSKLPVTIKELQDVSILLVEDNPLNVMVAKAFLERCGAVIDIACNGEEAIVKFDAARHQIVLMDLEMPVMDGYEATRELRKSGGNVPVIALTASLPKEVESEVFAAGLTDIIVKPFNPDDLFRVILLHLNPVAA